MPRPKPVSIEFEEWAQELLAAMVGTRDGAMALIGEGSPRIICSEQAWDYSASPCESCPSVGDCPLPGLVADPRDSASIGVIEQEEFPLSLATFSPAAGGLLPDADDRRRAASILSRSFRERDAFERQSSENTVLQLRLSEIAELSLRDEGSADVARSVALVVKSLGATGAALLTCYSDETIAGTPLRDPADGVPSASAVLATAEFWRGEVVFPEEGSSLHRFAQRFLDLSTSETLALLPLRNEHVSEWDVEIGILAVGLGGGRISAPLLDRMRIAGQLGLAALARALKRESADKIRLALRGPERIMGESRVAHQLRQSIARAADSPDPILVVGEEGTERPRVARWIHLVSNRNPVLAAARTTAALLRPIAAKRNSSGNEIWRALAGGEFGSFVHGRNISDGSVEELVGRYPTLSVLRGILAEFEGTVAEVFEALVCRVHAAWLDDPLFNLLELTSDSLESGSTVADRVVARATGLGGTVSVSSIDDLSTAAQRTLASALGRARDSKTPFVAASRLDLPVLVADFGFSQNVARLLWDNVIVVPKLGERAEDIPAYARSFAGQVGLAISREAIGFLSSAGWDPGDVLCLRAVVRDAGSRSAGPEIQLDGVREAYSARYPGLSPPSQSLEEQMIRRALASMDGNVTRAAEQIGWTRQRLYRRMNKLGIGHRTKKLGLGSMSE